MVARGATFVRNAGASNETSVTQQSTSFPQFRIEEDAGIAGLVKNFRLLVESVRAATMTSRSLPFGGPLVYVVAYSFTSGAAAQIPHRLGTANVRVWLGHKSAAGDVVVNSVDDTYATVTPTATFVADVLFLVTP
jgi:hypothetical protein